MILCRRSFPDILANAEVVKIAETLKRTPAQVLLRNLVQRGILVIPKSTNAGRLRQNFELSDFELSPEQMATIRSLDANERFCDFGFFKG